MALTEERRRDLMRWMGILFVLILGLINAANLMAYRELCQYHCNQSCFGECTAQVESLGLIFAHGCSES